MAKTFKALSALLAYPSIDLQQATNELRGVIETEALVPAAGSPSARCVAG